MLGSRFKVLLIGHKVKVRGCAVWPLRAGGRIVMLILAMFFIPAGLVAQDAQVKALRLEFAKGKARALSWAFNPVEQQAHEAAKTILAATTVGLKNRSEAIKQEMTLLEKQLENLPNGPAADAIEKEWERKSASRMEAEYWRAWSNYYYGVTLGRTPQAKVRVTQAKDIFQELLGFEPDEQIQPRDVDTLAVAGAAQLAVLVGVGQCELLLGNSEKAAMYFGLFERGDLVQDRNLLDRFREEAIVKQGETLLVARQFDKAAVVYRRLFAGKGVKVDKALSLAVRIVETAGWQPRATGSMDLWQVGLEELARQNRYRLCMQLIEKHQLNLEMVVGFYLNLVRGKQLIAQAKANVGKSEMAFSGASKSLQAALASPGSREDPSAASQCRYLLASCKFELKQYGEAAPLFEQASRRLEKKEAGDALWMSIVSYIRLNKNGDFAPSIIKLAGKLKRDFPTHPKVVGIDGLIKQVELSALTLEARVQELEEISPDDKEYDVARYEICNLRQQQWLQVKERSALAGPAGRQLAAAVDTYLSTALKAVAHKRLQAVLMAIDVHLNERSLDLAVARRYLATAAEIEQELTDGEPTQSQLGFHYRALRLARASGDQEETDRQAGWLIKHGRGSQFELIALRHAVGMLDKAKAMDASDLANGYQLCSRLVALQGSNVAEMKNDVNVRVATSRLAHYAYSTGRFDEAADLLDNLLEVFPKDRNYLQRAGRANFLDSRFERAQQLWKTVRLGVPRGTDAMYEAKYYELASLARIDRRRAAKVYRQFRVLYVELPAAWQKKFEALSF